MKTCQRGIILAAVALLLDPTIADILVQPGYSQPGQSSKKSAAQNGYYKNQLAENGQQNNVQQQNPSVQLLQQQHMLQQQQLQNQHQQEHNQLLQLQQQQLQDPAMHQYPMAGDEVVGTPWGLPHPMFIPPFGGLHGGKLFSLGPFGLNSFALGGLGGMGGPLLLAPQQPPETTGSNVLQKSMDSSAQPRTRRDVRDPGDSTGRKFRQKTSRPQQDGMAANPTLKSKPDAASLNAQSSKTDDDTVGDTRKNDEEVVGSGLLDPLGLVDKTEDLINDLKSGHLPNPISMLNNGGRLPGLPNFLNQPKPGHPHIEEHVVSQTQQHQYPTQSKSDDERITMNQQFQPDQSQKQFVGDSRYSSYPMLPSSIPGQSGQENSYGMYPQPYSSSGPAWMRNSDSMGDQGNRMTYAESPMVGDAAAAAQQFRGQTYQSNYPITEALYPATQQRMANSNGYPQMSGGVRNSMVGERPSPLTNSMYNRPILGAVPSGPNPGESQDPHLSNNFSPERLLGMFPKTERGVPGALTKSAPPTSYQPVGGPVASGERNSMVGNPMMNNFYDPSRNHPILGAVPSGPNPGESQDPHLSNNFSPERLLGMFPKTERGVPGAMTQGASPSSHQPVGGPMANGGRHSMAGRPMMNNFYDPSRRMNNYYGFNDGSQRHRSFDLDEIFDGGYDHHHHGGYDRIYGNAYDDSPFGFGGGYRPHHMHHQHSYF